jgi:flagellin
MTSQIRGLNQAVRNTNDGISLAQTAEGGLAETTSILQRVRELGVQAANDTNTDSDRASIQGEADALISELDRIAEKTTFNSQKILDGSFIGARFHVGANAGDTVSVSVRDARSTSLGRQVRQTSNGLDTTAISGDVAGAQLKLNDVTIRKTVDADDNVSFTDNAGSAIAKAQAINDATEFTGVSAVVEKTVLTAGNGVAAVTLDNQANLIINGETVTGFRVEEGDADGSLVDAINSVADATGVVASKNIDGKLELTAEDGRNISLTVNGDATNLGLLAVAGDQVQVAEVTLQSEENIVMESDGDILGLGASNLFGVNDAFSVNTIDVSTREGANLAIDIADVAISQVSGIRSELGATQNRLESTINNLAVSSENISAARSRIMDVDFAIETAEFTRNQIMQQVGISVLA